MAKTFEWRLTYSCLFVLLSICASAKIASGQTTATANQTLPTVSVFNIYWDSNWDADNPDLLRGKVDTATANIVNSTYMSALSEYGFQSATFQGGCCRTATACKKRPTLRILRPRRAGISQFIQCEHDNVAALQSSTALYNVILPESEH